MSRLLEEGSYGCAFSPALPCKKTKAAKGQKTVGKVIQAKYADLELQVAPLVQTIPGWKRYFIVQEEDSCAPTNFASFRKLYEKNCKTLSKSADANLVQLLSPYGGRTLYSLPITESFSFVGSLRHVLEGCELLGRQGICHFDLKDNNILVDAVGTLRLIDFGQSFIGDHVTDKVVTRHQYDFLPEYSPLPPELSIQNAIFNKLPIEKGIKEVIAKNRVFSAMQAILAVPLAHSEDELRQFWREQEEYKGGSWVLFFRTYWRVWDSWSVGVIFLRILQKCFLHTAFVEGVWKQHGPLLRQVLKGLLEADPRKRLLPGQAVDLLKGV